MVKANSKQLESAFTWGVWVYSLARAVLFWKPLQDAGLNPWIFVILDLAAVWPYARSLPELIRSIKARRWNRAFIWLLVLLASCVLPYLYLIVMGQAVKPWVWWMLSAFMVFSLGGLVVHIRRELKEA